ncbi:hypothetical protein M514_03794 [Trichuris suis]|uniref:Uncharacterized protein n=1 Tax=Trichuris suis TaxID=68888 RepID=A0A085MZN8_9BILA|nr:hypothetical protein M513_03794 [Trichuris suis]KFD62684.1 hypothetical protein M514_03794 [Trichuris suis]
MALSRPGFLPLCPKKKPKLEEFPKICSTCQDAIGKTEDRNASPLRGYLLHESANVHLDKFEMSVTPID